MVAGRENARRLQWWAVSDLNAGPSGCKPDALTAELTARAVDLHTYVNTNCRAFFKRVLGAPVSLAHPKPGLLLRSVTGRVDNGAGGFCIGRQRAFYQKRELRGVCDFAAGFDRNANSGWSCGGCVEDCVRKVVRAAYRSCREAADLEPLLLSRFSAVLWRPSGFAYLRCFPSARP